ncbi:signal peptide peptidase SppA [Afifella pfennigii]|uniref:signal peptide peptidase SppA n=1 Tax=Afifella pfennigii TaxID=209897 RepID=UPI00047B6578|nr:signal peptide peptidase SppA [Afifella pfennigii]
MDAEDLIERRRLRRRASFWRVTAFVVAIVAIIAIVGSAGWLGGSGAQVARISVDGFIPTRPDAVETLKKAARSKSVKAIIVRIDSPGGAATGGEALYRAVREAAEKKPVVALIDGLGASAAYMTAIGAEHIVARETAITGSIGVIFQFATLEELLGKIGIDYVEVKSTPLKGEPTPFEEPSPEAIAMVQGVIDSSYDWFVGLVAERRELQAGQARSLADGRIFTGRQAADNGLVDEVGDEDTARAWLESAHSISTDLPAKDWKKNNYDFGDFTAATLAFLLQAFGVDERISSVLIQIPERLAVDGLVSVWQGDSSIRSDR